MLFKNDYSIKCPQINKGVILTSSVDASAGMGCMVNYDYIDYVCEHQDTCPYYKKEKCLLSKEFDFSDLKQ